MLATPAQRNGRVRPDELCAERADGRAQLQQITNQITSLQNEAQMLINQARNLASLPYSSLQQLQQSVQRTQQLLSQAQNIAYDVQQIDQAFQTKYANVSMSASDAHCRRRAERWQNTVGGLQDAMRVQATVVGNIDTNRTQMSALVGASQSATGALAGDAGRQPAPRPPGAAARRPHRRRRRQRPGAGAAIGRAGRRRRTGPRTAPPLPDAGAGYQPGNAQMFHGN
jgi:hypothetical protein